MLLKEWTKGTLVNNAYVTILLHVFFYVFVFVCQLLLTMEA